MKRENEDVWFGLDVWLAGNDMSFESDWRWAIHFFVFSIIFFFSIPALFNLDGPMGLLMMTVAKTMRTVSS